MGSGITLSQKSPGKSLYNLKISIQALNFLNYEFKLNESVNMVIFIGLASLTFPHILLEYLIEKNEK